MYVGYQKKLKWILNTSVYMSSKRLNKSREYIHSVAILELSEVWMTEHLKYTRQGLWI